MADQDSHLFIVSTPLHLMVSIAIADTESLDDCHLVFVDQVKDSDNVYYQLMQEWAGSPFTSVSLFMRPPRSLLQKRHYRRQTFTDLAMLVDSIRPGHIYCGNDRRVEFQYCMHRATDLKLAPIGYYLDEGTFTYVGRKGSDSFSDRIIDNWSKKLAYGLWWQHPPTVGASSWIDTCYLSFPELADARLQGKNQRRLTLQYWHSERLQQFCQLLLLHLGTPTRLADYDAFYTLPHESVIAASPDYRDMIRSSISERVASNQIVGVKYHPRDNLPDALGIAELEGVELVEQQIPFEALLPLFKGTLEIIGDFSTTLITTRLLRPDLAVTAIDHGNAPKAFVNLYNKLGIHIVHQ